MCFEPIRLLVVGHYRQNMENITGNIWKLLVKRWKPGSSQKPVNSVFKHHQKDMCLGPQHRRARALLKETRKHESNRRTMTQNTSPVFFVL
jgi:hypothetical protein